ncbi:IS110 family transposase [Burkholderia gladioli]|uniref:IS110 family transposase n=2 Tax=Burkholderia gladioli TaxID=28095 RepID=UPI001640D6E1|nr:transposase [Burkholderia gladioli]
MFYLGIDVAKAKLDCCLLDMTNGKRSTKVVANSRAGLTDLLGWLGKRHTEPSHVHVALEGTGVYHEMAACGLHDAGLSVSVVNPAQVRAFATGMGVRTKNDIVDSHVLARFAMHARPMRWSPPAPEARILQALMARHEALAQDLQRERNRHEKAEITAPTALVLHSILETIEFLERHLASLQREIDDHIAAHPGLKANLMLLQSIPAVGPQVGRTLLAIMHARHFDSAEQLAAYLGLVPVQRQSGSSIQGPSRLSKAGPAKVRATLYMAAVVAKRYNPHIKALCERLAARGKSTMSILGAAMRKLVHLCFGVLKTRQPYRANYVAIA